MMAEGNEAPHVITWELTRACQLHCRHCRAKAIPRRDPAELSLDEISTVLDDLTLGFPHPPIVVFTGGDPLERFDLPDIIKAAVSRGLVTAVAPSVTPKLTVSATKMWRDLGVHSISLSLDGVDAPTHDGFRGVRGTFDRTVTMAEAVVNQGTHLQINTAISPYTVHQVPQMASLVQFLGVSSWELFFVIPTGRARTVDALDAEQIERVLEWLAEFAPRQHFRVTVVGAPQWTRVRHQAVPGTGMRTIAREARGFAFIDHRGEVFPSGYLPVSAGNVRSSAFSQIYLDSELFQNLRDAKRFRGACGSCEYREVCGGSRARAFALTGDVFASDPGCPRTLAVPSA